MKQVAKASAEWKAAINAENLFLITFGFHWRQMHGKVTAEVFGQKMRDELKVWIDRQRLVRGMESTPAEARSPRTAVQVHGPSPLRTREPSLPAIATLASADATPAPMVVTTTPPMVGNTLVAMAGPSNDRRQVSRQEAEDRLLAENLQAALHEDDPTLFRELDRSESSTEGDDEEDDGKKKGKGKAKMPSKRKITAGGTGVTRVIYTSAEDEEKQEEVGKLPTLILKIGRRQVKGTGEYFPKPCHTCARRNVSCEKTEGGQCVTCKRSKVKCSHVRHKQRRRVVTTRLTITDTDSDFETTAAAEASAPKRSAVAAKVPKRVQKPVKVAPESSDEEEVVPKTKKARNQDRVPREAEEVLGVVKGTSISRFHMSHTYLHSDYITRLNAQEDDNQQFRQLFTLLGEAVGQRTERMVRQGEYLNKVALAVLDLTQERLFELSAVQRRQTELLATLHRLITRGVGAAVLSPPEEWSEMLEREARAMHEANESRFQFLELLRSTAMDHAGIEVEMESQGEYVEEGENLQRRVEEARRMLKKPATQENIAEGSEDGGKSSANKATHAATSASEANVAATSANAGKVTATSADIANVAQKLAEDMPTSADDAEGETASADEGEDGKVSADESDTGKTSADEETSDMDVDSSAEEEPKVKKESEEQKIDVPTSVQGRVIDLTSNRPSPRMTGSLPTSANPPTTTAAVTVAPVINVISATPQTSQDAPGGTTTTLHPPRPEVIPSQRRSQS